MTDNPTFLFLATECKGANLVRRAKELGARTILIAEEAKRDEAWPHDSLDALYLMPDLSRRQDVVNGVSYLARETNFDRIVPLDDYDVEMAASLREHLRLPGMGSSTARFVRDKLAMRRQAQESGLLVPAYCGLFNDSQVNHFLANVSPPWVLKPRAEAGAIGIRRLNSADDVWRALDELGDQRSFHLLEQFVTGDIFHVDSVIFDDRVVFSIAHQYGRPPLAVTRGGVFTTRTLPRQGELAADLRSQNVELVSAMGLSSGVTHAEFIRGRADGRYYFLEVGARVGGANIAETVAFASGIDLWAEWAEVEMARWRGAPYTPPIDKNEYAGIIICLARQERPDVSGYQDEEIVWRLNKAYHAGLIVVSPAWERVEALLVSYSERFSHDFLAVGQAISARRTFSN